jgi:hypothetical protein
MLQSYKGRELPKKGQMVKVYYNLHNGLFSIKCKESGLVLAHGEHIQIKDPVFKVSEKGRQRVLAEGKKNVHAYVIGSFWGTGELDRDVRSQYDGIYYNPKTQDRFTKFGTMIDANSQNYTFVVLEENRKVVAR